MCQMVDFAVSHRPHSEIKILNFTESENIEKYQDLSRQLRKASILFITRTFRTVPKYRTPKIPDSENTGIPKYQNRGLMIWRSKGERIETFFFTTMLFVGARGGFSDKYVRDFVRDLRQLSATESSAMTPHTSGAPRRGVMVRS